jgi:hypothetical protein
MKIKNKKILAVVFALVFFFIGAHLAHADTCVCANGSIVPTYYPQVGDEMNLSDEKTCNSRCAQLNAKYYRWGTSMVFYSVDYSQENQATLITTICVCKDGNKKSFTKANVESVQKCNNFCIEKNAVYFDWGSYRDQLATQPSTPGGAQPAFSSYVPMEEIPGFGRPRDFPTYFMSVYKFGLWAIGICALLMVVIGGYMYITSAGNKSSAELAKKYITDAIIGLILAMLSWLILYVINPDLVTYKVAMSSQKENSSINLCV